MQVLNKYSREIKAFRKCKSDNLLRHNPLSHPERGFEGRFLITCRGGHIHHRPHVYTKNRQILGNATFDSFTTYVYNPRRK